MTPLGVGGIRLAIIAFGRRPGITFVVFYMKLDKFWESVAPGTYEYLLNFPDAMASGGQIPGVIGVYWPYSGFPGTENFRKYNPEVNI